MLTEAIDALDNAARAARKALDAMSVGPGASDEWLAIAQAETGKAYGLISGARL